MKVCCNLFENVPCLVAFSDTKQESNHLSEISNTKKPMERECCAKRIAVKHYIAWKVPEHGLLREVGHGLRLFRIRVIWFTTILPKNLMIT